MRLIQHTTFFALTAVLSIAWNTYMFEYFSKKFKSPATDNKDAVVVPQSKHGFGIPTWLQLDETQSQHYSFSFKATVTDLVDLAIASWKHIGIAKERLESALLLDDGLANQENCFGVQYVEDTSALYTWGRGPSERPDGLGELLKSRRRHILRMLGEVIKSNKFRIKSFEAVFCLGDCVMSRKHFHPLNSPWDNGYRYPPDPLPIFSIVTCQGSMNIPFPIWDSATGTIDDWETTRQNLVLVSEKEPWDTRVRQAIFRGDHRTCTLYQRIGKRRNGLASYSPNAESFENATKCGRAALMYRSLTSPKTQLFNVSLRYFEFDQLPRRPDEPFFIPMTEQAKFRYIIYAEGHCQWANRLRQMLFLGAAILFQDTECIEHYGMLLRPWIHYIPVDYWFTNLTDAVEWGESHPEETKSMISRMNEYGKSLLSRNATMEYIGQLISRYSNLMQYKLEERENAKAVTREYIE